jgi:hypothetical protein
MIAVYSSSGHGTFCITGWRKGLICWGFDEYTNKRRSGLAIGLCMLGSKSGGGYG